MVKFSIEDEVHAEWQGDYSSFEAALDEIKRRAALPWDEAPNRCPCAGWKKCERLYTITEYEVPDPTYTPKGEWGVMTISYQGVVWHEGFEKYGK